MLRRTRSGDRCPRSRGSLLPDGAELQFTAAEESLAVAPPGEDCAAAGGGGPLPTRRNLLQAAPCLPPRAGGWGSRGEPESVGWYGAGQWAVPQSRGHRCRGVRTAPALPCPCRAARRFPPGALQPLPLSPPSHPPCTQHPRPAPLRTLLPGGRPPRGWRMAKPRPCAPWVSGPALRPPERAPACKG